MEGNNKYNLLVVDDDGAVVDLICESLGDEYNMFVALAGAEGILLATQQSPPDLIILDINLPGKDGHMVAEQLTQNEKTRGIPIIFITGLRDDNEVVKSYEVGGNDLVFKPINVRILKEKVKAHLREYITQKELKRRSVTDPITHLHNSRGFNMHYKNLWLTAKVLEQPISFAFVSLDNIEDIPQFSGINNREDLLRTFSRKLSFCFENTHSEMALYCGYMFAVVVLNKSEKQMRDIIEALFQSVQSELVISVGIATGNVADFGNSETLKVATDRAWLEARKQNKEQQGKLIKLA